MLGLKDGRLRRGEGSAAGSARLLGLGLQRQEQPRAGVKGLYTASNGSAIGDVPSGKRGCDFGATVCSLGRDRQRPGSERRQGVIFTWCPSKSRGRSEWWNACE